MAKKLLIVCALLALISTNLFAQYDMKAPLPMDPNVRIGKLANGLTYLNDVRDRAGVEDAPSLTVDVVRNERQVELMYENHRFWDLKRWRQADKVMNNKKMKGLYPYWVANKKTWIFKKVEVGNAHDFKPYLYYIRINDDQRKLNPGIEQNPGY